MHQFLGIATIFLLLGLPIQIKGQCGMEIFPKTTYENLDNYHEIKGYRIDGKGGSRKVIEYVSVFSITTLYRIVITGKDGGSKGIIVTIYNSKREKVATNYQNNIFEEVFDFEVEKNGIYYMTFTFKESKSYCGQAHIGTKKR